VVAEGYSFARDFYLYFRQEYYEEYLLSFKGDSDISANDEEQLNGLLDSWYTSKNWWIPVMRRFLYHWLRKSKRKIRRNGIRYPRPSLLSITSKS